MIDLKCHNCGKQYRIDDRNAGKRLKCKKCESPIRVPERAQDDDLEWEEDGDDWEEDYEDDQDEPRRGSRRRKPQGSRRRSGKSANDRTRGKKKTKTSKKKSKSKKGLYIGLGAGGVVVTLIIVLCFVFLGGDSDSTNSDKVAGNQSDEPKFPRRLVIHAEDSTLVSLSNGSCQYEFTMKIADDSPEELHPDHWYRAVVIFHARDQSVKDGKQHVVAKVQGKDLKDGYTVKGEVVAGVTSPYTCTIRVEQALEKDAPKFSSCQGGLSTSPVSPEHVALLPQPKIEFFNTQVASSGPSRIADHWDYAVKNLGFRIVSGTPQARGVYILGGSFEGRYFELAKVNGSQLGQTLSVRDRVLATPSPQYKTFEISLRVRDAEFQKYGRLTKTLAETTVAIQPPGSSSTPSARPPQTNPGSNPNVASTGTRPPARPAQQPSVPEFHAVDLAANPNLGKDIGRMIGVTGTVLVAPKRGQIGLASLGMTFVVCQLQPGADLSKVQVGSEVKLTGWLTAAGRIITIGRCSLVSSTPPSTTPIDVTVTALATAFKDDKLGAHKKYVGRRLRAEGVLNWVFSASTTSTAPTAIRLTEPNGGQLHCMIQDLDIKSLRYGQTLIVEGTCQPAIEKQTFTQIHGRVVLAKEPEQPVPPPGSVKMTLEDYAQLLNSDALETKVPDKRNTMVVLAGKVSEIKPPPSPAVEYATLTLTTQDGKSSVQCMMLNTSIGDSMRVGDEVLIGGYILFDNKGTRLGSIRSCLPL